MKASTLFFNVYFLKKFQKEVRQTGRPRQQDFEFCMLIPYTDYTFTIVRKALRLTMTGEKSLGYVEAGYWSDPVSVIVKTLSDGRTVFGLRSSNS